MNVNDKVTVNDLALFGGQPVFESPVGTSGLARPSFDRFLVYSQQFFSARRDSNGSPLVRELEARLAAFHQAEHCITFCSGFWALVLAVNCLKLPGRSEVIMPSLTYRRMADLAAWAELKPRFCEVEPSTLAISARTAEGCISEETALIIGVHPIINCCDVEGLNQLSSRTGIPLLIDAVESVFETTSEGRVGSIARVEVFSLHASKLLNGAEGGYVTTSDPEIAQRLFELRNLSLGVASRTSQTFGLDAELNEMHAALALANLDNIDCFVAHNREIYATYQMHLPSVAGIRLVEFDNSLRSSFKNVVVELLDDWPLPRDMTLRLLEAERILARAYYSPALHQKPMRYPHVPANLPVTELLAERFVLMPSGFMVSTIQILAVIRLLQFIRSHASTIIDRIDAMAMNS